MLFLVQLTTIGKLEDSKGEDILLLTVLTFMNWRDHVLIRVQTEISLRKKGA